MMMTGYHMGYMGFSWLWAGLALIVAGLVIAALVKYLRK